MASYQIIAANPEPSFVRSLSSGLSSGSDLFTKTILPALIKKKQSDIDKSAAEEALEQEGFELDTMTVGEDGKLKRSFKRKETASDRFIDDPAKTIQKAILDLEDPEDIANLSGIKKPSRLNTDATESNFPIASLTGKAKNITSSGNTFQDAAREALRSKFAGGASNEEIGRDFLGLPQAKQTQEIPEEFSNDVAQLKDLSEGNTEVFVAGLEKIATKYTDNPEVLKRIKLIRSIFSGEQPFVPDGSLNQ